MHPVEGDMLDPMPFAAAVRRARAIRTSILAERKPATVVEQCARFNDDGGDEP